MTKIERLRPEYVDVIPDAVQDGILYISEEYGTALHKCCCGCGQEVVTPLGPTDWKVRNGQEGVIVHPSIGNWSFDCQSHYWIDQGRIYWANQWTLEQIRSGRVRDQQAKQDYFDKTTRGRRKSGFWARLWRLFTGR